LGSSCGADQVAHLALGHFQRHGGGVELAVRQEAVDRAFEVASVMGDATRQIFQHLCRNVEARMMRPGAGDRDFRMPRAQFLAERSHLDTSPPRDANGAVVKGFRSEGGRPRDHHLAAGSIARSGVAELGLVDFLAGTASRRSQNVDAAQRLLECECGLGLKRSHKTVHEFLGGEIKHLALDAGIAGPGHGLQQMGFAEAQPAWMYSGVEHHGTPRALRDLTSGGVPSVLERPITKRRRSGAGSSGSRRAAS